MYRLVRTAVVTISITIIFVFSIGTVLPPYKAYSVIENRSYFTAPFRNFSRQAIKSGALFQDINKTFEDQFFQRERFVELYSWVQYKLGKKKINGKVLGQDNYIFGIHYPEVSDRYMENLNELGEYCADEGINLFFCLIPTKDLILIDKVPVYYRNDTSHVFKYVESRISDKIHYISLYSDIKKAQRIEPQYYKTDHHWNTNGVFTGYNRVVNEIRKVIPEVGRPYSRDSFTFVEYEDIFIGSSGRAVTASVVKEFDDIVLYYPKFSSSLDVNGTNTEDYPLYHLNLLSEEPYNNDYAVYLGGAEQDLVIRNNAVKNNKTAIVVGISYAPPLTILLAEHFKEISYIDLRYTRYPNLYSLIEDKKPDAVIFLYYSGVFDDTLYTFK